MTEGTDNATDRAEPDAAASGKSRLTLSGPGTLELKKTVGAGQIRQSISPRRTKTVTVEVRRKRTFERGGAASASGSKKSARGKAAAQQGLSGAEREKRLQALAGREQEEARRRAELQEQERRAAEINRRRAEEEARLQAEAEEARRRQEEAEATARKAATAASAAVPAPAAEANPRGGRDSGRGGRDAKPKTPERKAAPAKAPARAKGEPRRRQGKLTISQALEGGDIAPRTRSLAAVRRARDKERQQAQERRARHEKVVRTIVLPETVTVGDLANRMAERTGDLIKTLMRLGVMATRNHALDADTAELVVAEFGHRARRVTEADVEIGLRGDDDAPETLKPRAPVVVVMGHVDHGKTSLLDALRRTDVREGEAGGITQHIGAYEVTLSSGARITFLDTPGHEAFTQMRMRGAQVTDIVVLVVAADDGVQPQTQEAISHARAAGTPIIVAITKCDRPEADPTRVKTKLLEHELVPEDMGGDIQCVEVASPTGAGLDKLEEAILLQAELMELSANPDRRAEGAVVEARLEKGRGPVATVLVRRGTARVGDAFVAGAEWGRVRAMMNDRGETVEAAGPAAPVEIIGLQGTPMAGDDFVVLESESRAREIATYRQRKARESAQTIRAGSGGGSMEEMMSRIKTGEVSELPVVVKADVQGSLEAITTALGKMEAGDAEARVRVLHGAVGGITESDVGLAASAGGMVIGFNVRANPQARDMARRDGVDIRYYAVIYDLVDDAKKALQGLLAPELRENLLGYAEIREVFNIGKTGRVGGCYITEGMVRRGARVRLLRDDVVIHEGALKTLRRFRDDVREVQTGYECGMAFENYEDIKPGDRIECFEMEEVTRAA